MNSHRHFFLYAKGHYKTGDLFEDLGKICDDYLGHNLHNNGDRIEILIGSLKFVKKAYTLEKIMSEVFSQTHQWNAPFDFGKHEVSGTNVVVLATLNIMRHLTIHEIEGELGEPDYNILPKPGLVSTIKIEVKV